MRDLSAIELADWSPLDPRGRRIHRLVGIVDRKQDAIGANRQHGADERLVVEEAAGRDEDVVAEIVLQTALQTLVGGIELEAVLNPPREVRQRLAKVTEHQ